MGCARAQLRSEDCLTELEGFETQVRQNSELEASAIDETLAAVSDLEG